MSIKHVKDNICNFTSWNVLLHVSNCKNTFGAGLALQIKNEYPAAYEADCLAAKEGRNTLGNFSVATVAGGKKIINLYGQADFGTEKRQLDYEALYVGLEQIKILAEKALKEEGRNNKIGIPYKIGCGLAGASWTVVEAMIKDLFENSPVEIYIVEYVKK